MKKLILFASALALLFTTSCDELPGGSDDNNNDNIGGDLPEITQLVKSLSYDTENNSMAMEFAYDEQERITNFKVSGEIIRDGETLSHSDELNYTYGDGSVNISKKYSAEQLDGTTIVRETSAVGETNSDGYITAYTYVYEEKYTFPTIDQVTNEKAEETATHTHTSKFTFSYTGGYLTSSTCIAKMTKTFVINPEYNIEDPEWSKFRCEYDWINGNLVEITVVNDFGDKTGPDGELIGEAVTNKCTIDYSTQKNTLNISYLNGHLNVSGISGYEPNLFGKGTANLTKGYTTTSYNELGKLIRYAFGENEFTVVDGVVTQFQGRGGSGENKNEAEAEATDGAPITYTYYE